MYLACPGFEVFRPGYTVPDYTLAGQGQVIFFIAHLEPALVCYLRHERGTVQYLKRRVPAPYPFVLFTVSRYCTGREARFSG
ncbi:MAG: hypothetical protein BWY05_01342 [Euryarchaeota archaeon ADurb.Bin165]|nr:MAG: hypothetical protein BWY05_01342 [Euryarchaeota archaeon ADurb.Bin165]